VKQTFNIGDKVVVIGKWEFIGGVIATPPDSWIKELFNKVYKVHDIKNNFIGEIINKNDQYHIIKNFTTNELHLINNHYNEIRHYYKGCTDDLRKEVKRWDDQ